MAHAHEKRTKLRGLFVYQRQPMETACKKLGIPRSTANRWKQEAKDQGDDWDTARAAVAMGDESLGQLSRQLLEDYLLQHRVTMEMLRKSPPGELNPKQHAEILASLSDSFNKTMSSFKRLSPKINEQAIALDALTRLVSFAKQKFPQHAQALAELLEPFGEELARAYG